MGCAHHPGRRNAASTPLSAGAPTGTITGMAKSLICVIDGGPQAAAATAFGLWIGSSIAAHPRVCLDSGAAEIAAVASEHEAELIVVPSLEPVAGSENRVLELLRRFPGSIVAFPPDAVELWLNPQRARERIRPVIVAGIDGSPHSFEAASEAGRLASALSGSAFQN